MKLLAPLPTYPLLPAASEPRYGVSRLYSLARYAMVMERLADIRRSIEKHDPGDCPFKTTQLQDGKHAPFHGDDCRWGQLFRVHWLDTEVIGLSIAAAELAKRAGL